MAKESKANAPVSGGRIKEKEFWAIMEEMTRLYGGWLCYLLRRQGETTLRVRASDIAEAIRSLTCSVEREGDDYIITCQGREGEHDRGS